MWLRWRAKSSSSAGTWAWKHFPTHLPPMFTSARTLPEVPSNARSAIESFLEEQSQLSEYDNEHHRGIEWTAFADGLCPREIIETQIDEAKKSLATSQQRAISHLMTLGVELAKAKACPQCIAAHSFPRAGGYQDRVLCPRCGRELDKRTLPYFILPRDSEVADDLERDALDLLGNLAEFPRKSKSRDKDLITRVESPAMQVLVDRGLAWQSNGPEGAEARLSDRGREEYSKHQQHETKLKLQAPKAAKPKTKTKGRKRK